MQRWVGRVALVTGASAGIGAAICKQLVEAGMVVIGAARGVERIQNSYISSSVTMVTTAADIPTTNFKALSEELKGKPGTLVGVKCDLTKDQDIYDLFSTIKEKYKGVDVCINNAGMSFNKTLLDGTPEEWRYMLDVHVTSLCLCTKLSVKSMLERGVDDGHIIHVNGISGYYVPASFPTLHFMYGVKHNVRALTEGMRFEIATLNANKGSKLRVSSISPGIVKTEFQERNLGADFAKELFKTTPVLESSDIAASVCHILGAPSHVQVHDLIIRPTGENF